MSTAPVIPKHQALRRAIAWLLEQKQSSAHLIDEACVRFDVSPADEEFLIAEYRRLCEQRHPQW